MNMQYTKGCTVEDSTKLLSNMKFGHGYNLRKSTEMSRNQNKKCSNDIPGDSDSDYDSCNDSDYTPSSPGGPTSSMSEFSDISQEAASTDEDNTMTHSELDVYTPVDTTLNPVPLHTLVNVMCSGDK